MKQRHPSINTNNRKSKTPEPQSTTDDDPFTHIVLQNSQNFPKKKMLFKQFTKESIASNEASVEMSKDLNQISSNRMKNPQCQVATNGCKNDKKLKIGQQILQRGEQKRGPFNREEFKGNQDPTIKISLMESNPHVPPAIISNKIQLNSNSKQFVRPQLLVKDVVSGSKNHEIKVTVTPQNQNTSFLRDQQIQTIQQRNLREQKVIDFMRKQNLLTNLKCSNGDVLKHDNLNKGFNLEKKTLNKYTPNEQCGQTSFDNSLTVLASHKSASNLSEKYQPQTSTQVNKKLKLKDYLSFNQLSTKARNTGLSSSISQQSNLTIGSSFRSPLNSATNGRRKPEASNSQIMKLIKKDISTDIELMKTNLDLLSQIFKAQESGQPQQSEIMNVYAVSRIIKDKLLKGNDEIVKYLNNSHRKAK